MRGSFVALLFLILPVLPASPQDLVVKEDPLPASEQIKKFHLPPGFKIELVAAEPDIAKPMNLAFDDRGRLFVTSSYEYPFPVKEGMKGRDAVRMLEDFGPDGRARKVTTFVDGLNIPIGLVPTPDGIICHSIPKVWRAFDADGDGKCEKRDPLYGDIGTQDTHGMVNAFTPWLDGWIYACHGFANKSNMKSATTDSQISMHSGNTWRMRPDGSQIEYYTHGQVNPFGLCFDALGNLYSADCHSLPIYHLLRGGYYPTFGGEHDGLGHAPSVMSHLHGSTAIGGIVYYAATNFPEKYRDTVFVGNPVTGRINHDVMEKHGSSHRAKEQADFLRCDDKWFRPVDIKLAPDGSLYVADFYNRIIGHYEVPLTHPGRDRERGRIWRISWTGDGAAPHQAMPNLFKSSAEELIALLKHENLQVRVRATNQLADRIGAAAVDPLKKAMEENVPFVRAHGLWVLERTRALDESLVRKLADDGASLVRVHTLKALAERKTWTFEAALAREKLKDADPYVRRAAAEALSLHPAAENVQPLLELWSGAAADDSHLIYMARLSLRNQLIRPGGFDGLPADEKLANVAVGAKTSESAAYLLSYLKAKGGDWAKSLPHIVRYIDAAQLPGVFDLAKSLEAKPPREQLPILRAVSQGCQERGVKLPEAFSAWAQSAVGSAFKSEDKGLTNEAIKLCRDLKLDSAAGPLEELAQRGRSQDLRLSAIDALPPVVGNRAVAPLGRLVGTAEEVLPIRQKAAQALAALNTPEARAELVTRLQSAPQGLAVVIAVGLAASKEGGEALLGAVETGKAPRRLLLDKGVDGRLRAGKSKELVDRMEKVTRDLPAEDPRITELLQTRRKGFAAAKPNAAHGAELFLKTCAGCHKIDGKGQKVGPELDAVWTRGVDRLLEDVLDPNRNVDQAFRATLIKTNDDRVISGLVLREEGQLLVVQEAADKETKVPIKDIQQRVLSQLSPMPGNVTDALSEADFYDLLGFLLQQRGQK
jgi:putative heme-binding domain-containing protein